MVTFLGPRHRLAPSVDHITPLDQIDLGSAEGRAFALSQRNLRVCHIGCNSKRGNRTKRVPRVWNLNDYVTGRSQRW
jgi:5-methylcytosine-specific restriction endonuclease McrA